MKECPTCSRCFPNSGSLCPTDGGSLTTTLSIEPLLDGRYQLRRRLGQGGMGVVFKARHILLKTTHAIKIILPDLAGGDPEFFTRFRQEAMAAAAIRHHNVIAVTDYGVLDNSTPFLVMEFIQGESLHDLLIAEKRLSPERALEIMEPVGAGVYAAHRRGIVHRDLKPLNIMIEDDLPLNEAVKVLDFGLAKIKSGELLGSFVAAKTIGLIGSPYYMAPEQWSEEEPDKSADIYSLGVLLFQMLTGEPPFKGPNAPTLMKKHLMDEPPRFAELGVAMPPAVEEVVRHALEKRPERRPATAPDFINELRDAVKSSKGSSNFNAPFSHGPRPTPEQFANTFPSDADAASDNAQADTVCEERLRAEQESRQWDEAEALRAARAEARKYEEEEPDVSNVTLYALSGVAGASEPSQESLAVEAREDGSPLAAPSHRPTRRPAIRIPTSAAGPEVVKRPLRWLLVGGAAAAVLLACVSAIVIYRSASTSVSNNQSPVAVAPTEEPTPPTPNLDQILIRGGTFKMGRGDLPSEQTWFFIQWPAHEVPVPSFYMDRTEVTNAEYAEFVKETGHPAPSDTRGDKEFPDWKPWVEGKPPAGQERWPVRNVTVRDAEAFAAWRSKRDQRSYRLPTEDEWEYAARGGGKFPLYPWGDKWEDDSANVDTGEVRPVGSHPKGRTEQSIEDMIGNVWEWTSSKAYIYKGNRYGQIPSQHKSHIVIRGGSYESKIVGKEPITATSRQWFAPTFKSPTLGFRLVREAPKQ